MNDDPAWLVWTTGEQRGPLALPDLKALAAQGALAEDALVKRADRSEWQAWRRVPELADATAWPPWKAQDPGAAAPPPAGAFGFRRLIAPRLLPTLFWIGLPFVVAYDWTLLAGVFDGAARPRNGLAAAALLLFGLLTIPLSVLVWRVHCEVLAVLFGLFQILTEVRDRLDRR